jgi:hypothetical protein
MVELLISAWLPAFVEWSFFGSNASHIDRDGSVVVVFRSVDCEHHAYDHNAIGIIIKAYLILIALTYHDTILGKSCDLAVILENGIPESFMSVETIANFVTLAIENALPPLLAPKVEDPAI